MKSGIFYHKRTGQPVQIIARAQTKPTFQEVICYQELTDPYEYFVMERRQFFADYVRKFEELPLVGQKQLDKREDLPDKMPRISKGEVKQEDPNLQNMMRFFDAESYGQKLKLFEEMEEDLNDHMLNNIAVSLDLPLEGDVNVVELIKSELQIRSKYEGERGDRL